MLSTVENLAHSVTGLVHVLTAIAAMVVGALVLLLEKGTRTHRFFGYGYFFLMLTLNGTAFMLYGLFGTFGPFHVAAVISLLTLLAGFVPVIRRKPTNKWLMQHFTFMYFSVVGLYAAFASETLTRIPSTPFFTMVFVASFLIILIGIYIFKKMRPQWSKILSYPRPGVNNRFRKP